MQTSIDVRYDVGEPFKMAPTMIFGHGRNTLGAASFPKGCSMIRLHDSGVNMGQVAISRGQFSWAKLDGRVAEAQAQGLPLLYTFSNTPSWASLSPQDLTPALQGSKGNCPLSSSDYRAIVTAIATRYKGKIKAYEVRNESNYKGFYNGSADQLLQEAKDTYEVVKSIDPDALVTTPNVTYSYSKNNIITALTNLFSRGFQQYADVISFHGYLPDKAPSTDSAIVFAQLEQLCQTNSITMPWWDTEFGFKLNTMIPDTQKRQWIIDALMVRMQFKLGAAFLYQWDNTSHTTCVLPDGTLTIAGKAWMDVYDVLHPVGTSF